ncbi:MAG: RluA family pseudouridine synthase, partial [Myxococcota bacterium]
LSGLDDQVQRAAAQRSAMALSIVYEDEHFFVVDKPSGLLSVPGRRSDTQDCVTHRIRHLYPDVTCSGIVHRLDMNTSGLLIVARHAESQRRLTQMFRKRAVQKRYEALLCGTVEADQGEIHLPLAQQGYETLHQGVDHQQGKPAHTRYRVLERSALHTRVEFEPVTGRTHQLRVHAASEEGLNAPILGDNLYHHTPQRARLHLHARDLLFVHPYTGQQMHLCSEVPF